MLNYPPDLKNGNFLQLEKSLNRAITRYPFNLRQLKILNAIMDKTYGWGKIKDDIAISQLSEMTGIQENHCSSTIKKLVSLNVITKEKGKYAYKIGINKFFRDWEDWNTEWEWWNKDRETEKSTEDQAKQEHQPTQPKEPRALTEQEFRCWEWAKNEKFWQKKVQTQAFFLEHYQSQRKTLKTQYERFCSDLEERNSGVKNEQPTQQQHYFQQKYGINELLSGRPINASVNPNSTMSAGVGGTDAGIIQGIEKQPLEQVEYAVLDG